MLSGDEIAASIEALSVSRLASVRKQERLKILRQVATGDYARLHDVVGAAAVRAFLDAASICWTDEFRARLGAIRLEVLTPDLFHACATRDEAGPKVIIYRGFLKALAFFLELIETDVAVERRLRWRFWAYRSRAMRKRADLFTKLPLIFYAAGRSDVLPRPNAALGRDHRAELFHKFAVCLSFIVMHELGHIELGHLAKGGEGPKMTPPLLIASEQLDDQKLREFEADSFVVNGLAPDWNFFARGQCASVLGFLTFIEGRIEEPSASHPMSINRLHHALNDLMPGRGASAPSYANVLDRVVSHLSNAAVKLAAARAAAPHELPDWVLLESANEVSGMALVNLQVLYHRWVQSRAVTSSPEADAQAEAWANWMTHLFPPEGVPAAAPSLG
jgi:hypothetical protein